ncbi:hypothetical protein [Galactobacter valiniphilus]|uniref:hypothetical protein n=1 Tax=Galactobacter valiniphilus TaxID=2676122 RepID=UPI0037365F8F
MHRQTFSGTRPLFVITPRALPIPEGAPVLPRNLVANRQRLVEARQAGPFARLVYDVAPPA